MLATEENSAHKCKMQVWYCRPDLIWGWTGSERSEGLWQAVGQRRRQMV